MGLLSACYTGSRSRWAVVVGVGGGGRVLVPMLSYVGPVYTSLNCLRPDSFKLLPIVNLDRTIPIHSCTYIQGYKGVSCIVINTVLPISI